MFARKQGKQPKQWEVSWEEQNNMEKKRQLRLRRRRRIRATIKGTSARPRLAVFRSNTALYAQLVDDTKGITLASANVNKKNREAALALAGEIVQKAKEKKLTTVVFDRGGFRYHGVIQTFADAVREGGLTF